MIQVIVGKKVRLNWWFTRLTQKRLFPASLELALEKGKCFSFSFVQIFFFLSSEYNPLLLIKEFRRQNWPSKSKCKFKKDEQGRGFLRAFSVWSAVRYSSFFLSNKFYCHCYCHCYCYFYFYHHHFHFHSSLLSYFQSVSW